MIRMNVVLGLLGKLLKVLGLLMLVPGGVAAIYQEPAGVVAFGLTSFLALIAGMILDHGRHDLDAGNREAFGIVSICWLLAAFFGALPFVFCGMGMVDALFESISGFSATGATILTESSPDGFYILNRTASEASIATMMSDYIISAANISIPAREPTYFGLLFWRAFSQLIGGMGIVILFVAVLPQLRVAGRQLFKAESVGPTKDTIVPRAKNAARILWGIYLLLNAVEIALLLFAGMPLFDAICTAFSTLATGGFSPRASSLVYYSSPLIDAIVAVFIFLGASNFTIHYRLLHGDWRSWINDAELRFFVGIIAVATAAIMIFGGIDGDPVTQFRLASFQVISFIGTCGFVNTLTYDSWTPAAKLSLIMVMLIGGCAGSTAGGIKVFRLAVSLKYAYGELFRMLHPKAMTPIKVGGITVQEDILRPILFYSFFYLAAFFALSLALTMVCAEDPALDLTAALSGVASCMGGVGPAFGVLTFDWYKISPVGKMIGFFCMYIGRLEIMPVILLLVPDLWKE